MRAIKFTKASEFEYAGRAAKHEAGDVVPIHEAADEAVFAASGAVKSLRADKAKRWVTRSAAVEVDSASKSESESTKAATAPAAAVTAPAPAPVPVTAAPTAAPAPTSAAPKAPAAKTASAPQKHSTKPGHKAKR